MKKFVFLNTYFDITYHEYHLSIMIPLDSLLLVMCSEFSTEQN